MVERSRWQRIALFARKKAFVITIVGGLLGAAYSLIRLYHYEPPANAGIEFDGFIVGYMRPDLGLADDMRKMGIKKPSTKVIGMSQFDILMGTLRNKGSRDAEELEIKVPVDGTLSFAKVSGIFDQGDKEYDHSKANVLGEGEATVVPGQYFRLLPMRVDDPPITIRLFCEIGSVSELSFRYKQGDTTKTQTYVRRTYSEGHIQFNQILFWGMDSSGLKAFAVRCAYWLAAVSGLVAIGYWQRARVWGWIKAWTLGLWKEWRALRARIWAPSNTSPEAKTSAPNVQPARSGPVTKKERKRQQRREDKRRRDAERRGDRPPGSS